MCRLVTFFLLLLLSSVVPLVDERGKFASLFEALEQLQNNGQSQPSSIKPNLQEVSLELDEIGTKFTQKNIFDEENNLLINIVPPHNNMVGATFVFDGDSDLMMIVKPIALQCTVQKSFLPIPIKEAFDNIQLKQSARSTNRSIYNGNAKQSEDPVSKRPTRTIIGDGSSIKKDDLPSKFQPHCPDGYSVYTTHTVETWKATKDDPFTQNKGMINKAELYDFVPPNRKPKVKSKYGRDRSKQCVLYTGSGEDFVTRKVPLSKCYVVTDHKCNEDHLGNDVGCPEAAMTWQCQEAGPNDAVCVYMINGCVVDGVTKTGCTLHFTSGDQYCRRCCAGIKCKYMKMCKDLPVIG